MDRRFGEIIKTTRNPYLDYLRGMSALLVLMFHYTKRYDMLFGHAVDYPVMVNRGSFAVLMFFLLSGYLTFKGLPKYKPGSFVKNRFFRLFPTYWLCLIITMIVVSLSLPELAVSIKDFLLNFTMLPMYWGAKYVDGAYWTLSCELLFYVLIVCVCLLKGGKYGAYVIIGWFILQLGFLFIPDSGVFALAKKFNRLLYFHCFMAGGIVALLEGQVKMRQGDGKNYSIFTNIILGLALVFFVAQQFIDHETDSGIFMAVSVVLLCVSVILYDKLGGGHCWVQKILSPFAWVASISYPLYLLHQNIGYAIIHKMESMGLTSEWGLMIPIVVIFIAAWIIHKIVEKPCTAFGTRH